MTSRISEHTHTHTQEIALASRLATRPWLLYPEIGLCISYAPVHGACRKIRVTRATDDPPRIAIAGRRF